MVRPHHRWMMGRKGIMAVLDLPFVGLCSKLGVTNVSTYLSIKLILRMDGYITPLWAEP